MTALPRPPIRENLVIRSALVRGRVVKRVGGDAGWEIADRIFAKCTGGRTCSARIARRSSWNRRT
jgi:hypothetical protein